MTRLPLVGVTTSRTGGRAMWWFYRIALRMAGIRPVRMTPPADAGITRRLDGLVIGGGDDIGAEIYNGTPSLDVRIDAARDHLELDALEQATRRGIPVMGVCRGAQMLNVFHGGSLHQDLHQAYSGVPRMWTPLPRKWVDLDPGSRISAIMGVTRFRANSLHNQSIDRPGEGLRVAGTDRHGIIQAVEDPSHRFRIGAQWHPEFMIYRSEQRRLFKAFAEAVRDRIAEG